ncbi:unnamed protein product [Tenebrio molitor]|nr:unnamed protein product [Tenebrio molitor]
MSNVKEKDYLFIFINGKLNLSGPWQKSVSVNTTELLSSLSF